MNGSEAIVNTLLDHDVDVCFANPGTSEMHFVAALDSLPRMRCILGLFEGVATGAADGYYRMADRPAATLLHLGPGVGNGWANLHNARRAGSGVINIIGQHALDHIANDAPLTSDIEGVAGPVSHWTRTITALDRASQDTAAAIDQARQQPGRIASLILPADVAWQTTHTPRTTLQRVRPKPRVADEVIESIAQALTEKKIGPANTAILLGGRAMRANTTEIAGKIAQHLGCHLLAETKNARSECGRGRVNVRQMPYPIKGALESVQDIQLLILVGAQAPVAFFAYPDTPRFLTRPDCTILTLAQSSEDMANALTQLAERLGAAKQPAPIADLKPNFDLPSGPVTSLGISQSFSLQLPANCIVVDEAITTGRQLRDCMPHAEPHDWLEIPGGSIGYGLPAAVGAAVACPDRRVVAIVGDGSAMYTVQALWSMARENLNITVIICANRKYQILRGELEQMKTSEPGPSAQKMLNLNQPELDWVALARGHGLNALRAENMEAFNAALRQGLQQDGPLLIEAII